MNSTLTLGSLFSGIGGLDLGLECALRDGGFCVETVWQCEADAWCRGILARHWPHAVQYDDVRAVGPDASRVDVLCGGFPCQDVSYAGKGAGLAGERSGLWFEFARVVRDLRPRIVVVENVAALATRGLDAVLGSLSEAGYDAVWFDLRASDVGAPHRRERLFIVGWRVDDSEHLGRVDAQVATLARTRGGGSPRPNGSAQPAGSGRGARWNAPLADTGCFDGNGWPFGDSRGRTDGNATRRDEDPRDTQRCGESVADAIGGRRDGRALGAEGNHSDRTDARRPQGSDGASDGRARIGESVADASRQREREPTDEAHPIATRRDARSVPGGRGDVRGGAVRGSRRRDSEPGMGGVPDGLPCGLDAHRWPAGRGEPQHEWEPPRTAKGVPNRSRRLKALGNAVVPQVGYVVGCVVAEVLREGVA